MIVLIRTSAKWVCLRNGLQVFPPFITQHRAMFYWERTMGHSLPSHGQLDKGALWLVSYFFSLLMKLLPFDNQRHWSHFDIQN